MAPTKNANLALINTNSTNSLILYPSLDDVGEGVLRGYKCIVYPSITWVCALCPVAILDL